MDAEERQRVCGEVDRLTEALARERWRHVAGLEPEPALAGLFTAHGRAAHQATVKLLRDEGEADLAARVARLRAERVQAEAEERWRAAEVTAVGQGPDGTVGLAAAELALLSEPDRDRRLQLGLAAAGAACGPDREAAVELRARARAEVGLVPDWEAVVAADGLLAASDDAYRDILGWLARREAGLALPPRGDLARADLLFVMALHGWDGLFPPEPLARTLEQTARELGLDLRPIRIDEGKRPAQWPGAHALESRVAFRRQGGAADWLCLLDAAGQALAAAAAPPHQRHPAAPFTIGGLLAGLLLDPGWLRARLRVDRGRVPDLARALASRQLFRLRARAAALRVAVEVERGASGAPWHEAHRAGLRSACFASWPAGLAARDGDAGLLAAQLAGWARAEALRTSLLERCDEDWWRNPRSAALLASWLAAGGAWGGEEPGLDLAARALTAKL